MLLVVTDDRRLLLHHRDDILGIPHPGCWAGFGGAVEDGETVEEALRREVREETGLDVAEPVFLTEEIDHEGDGRRVSMFYVLGGIEESDIDLREGAGIGVFDVAAFADLPVPAFVRHAIDAHLVKVLGEFGS
jgi:8-oxo-dGTP pyrophosphatase MutT (NUDIX family)